MWKDFLEWARKQAMGERIHGIIKSGCLVLLLFALINCRDISCLTYWDLRLPA